MKNDVFNVVLLLALPASGKSEVRNFLAQMDPEVLKRDFHIGENVQLDDFPYVHFMKRIDIELLALGQNRIFYPGDDPFIDARDWATLINLLNEDYYDLVNRCYKKVDSAARLLFDRIDNAALKVGINPRLSYLKPEIKEKLIERLEAEARALQDEKEAAYTDDLENKTIVIEAARGGADGASLPLKDPFGYQYSLRYFAPELLEKAVILYIQVTPEESRRKNAERANPDDPGSILNHGVPLSVMLGDYGIDDMLYLRDHSEIKDTVTVKAYGHTYHLPIGIFDNRKDKTTFLRQDKKLWSKELVDDMTASVKEATDTMYRNYHK
ncbi:MAG: hypothetical protein IKE33_01680 [Erysipelotrichaceae bacterium]|nr:hypothetical protein [Erysipelotrichaceae bacterium]